MARPVIATRISELVFPGFQTTRYFCLRLLDTDVNSYHELL